MPTDLLLITDGARREAGRLLEALQRGQEVAGVREELLIRCSRCRSVAAILTSHSSTRHDAGLVTNRRMRLRARMECGNGGVQGHGSRRRVPAPPKPHATPSHTAARTDLDDSKDSRA